MENIAFKIADKNWATNLRCSDDPLTRVDLTPEELDFFERIEETNGLEETNYLFRLVDETNWRKFLAFAYSFISKKGYPRLKTSYEERNIPVSVQGIWLFRKQSFVNGKILNRVNVRLYKGIDDYWLAVIAIQDYHEGYSIYDKHYQCYKLDGVMDLLKELQVK